eukprot:UN12969
MTNSSLMCSLTKRSIFLGGQIKIGIHGYNQKAQSCQACELFSKDVVSGLYISGIRKKF